MKGHLTQTSSTPREISSHQRGKFYHLLARRAWSMRLVEVVLVHSVLVLRRSGGQCRESTAHLNFLGCPALPPASARDWSPDALVE